MGRLDGVNLWDKRQKMEDEQFTSKLLYIKLQVYLFFYMELILEEGKSITRGIGEEGWALEISTFLYPKGIRFAHSHFRAQRSLDWILPASKQLRLIHNRYINSYYTFSGVRQKVKALLTVHLQHHF
jgi:hypothetical protein